VADSRSQREQRQDGASFPIWRTRLPLLILLLAGATLRLFRLGAQSLWYDETVSVYLAGSALPELIRHTAGDIHPPGYYVLLRGWLVALGYPTGHADPHGIGLEFAAGFFSLFFGVLLIALAHALARRVAGDRAALVAAGLVAFSPYNVWYSQEVRMYTLGAGLGAVALYALLRGVSPTSNLQPPTSNLQSPISWWVVYALAAAAGMYTLYYFAFLLAALNAGVLAWLIARTAKARAGRRDDGRSRASAASDRGLWYPWLAANLAALLLYAPWLPIAYRQAVNPPVPPWRTATVLSAALTESWAALSLGQSAPAWAWPVVLIVLAAYAAGLVTLWRRPRATDHGVSSASIFLLATFGALGLILLASIVTPLYHVRYVFTYSPAFYVVLAAGLNWSWGRWRLVVCSLMACWLAASGFTLHAFWTAPADRADDHRAAVRFLRDRWRPGDVALVNAGYAYTALLTYWDGPAAFRGRLTADLPAPAANGGLVVVTTGHVDAAAGLGWADPRSDFFAMPAAAAETQVAALFERFARIWHYRIYDTVNDPAGLVRGWMSERGQLFDERVFDGEANMRVQGYLCRSGVEWPADRPAYRYAAGVTVQPEPLPVEVAAGQTLYAGLLWRADATPAADIAVSLRLVGPDGRTWAQPPDEKPAGPLFQTSRWPAGQVVRQPIAMPIGVGTPPGAYTLALLVYDPATGAAWPPQEYHERLVGVQNGLNLGLVNIARARSDELRPPLARFGPLALVEASSPATAVSPGDAVPVELLWQAVEPPQEPLVVVVQLLAAGDRLVANLEEEPAGGRYPTQQWAAAELVRDHHALGLPSDLSPGTYRLIVGVYRAGDRVRLKTRVSLSGERDHFLLKTLTVE